MKKKILVIEDSPTVLALLKDVLEREGYAPILAESSREGIKLVGNKKDDLLITEDKKSSGIRHMISKKPNGEHILEMIKEVMPDLIIMDIMMPEVSGMQVKAQMNSDHSIATIPVIFLTAKNTISDKVKGLHLGADDYITKPFDTEELLARIYAALRRKEFYEELSMTDVLTGLYNRRGFLVLGQQQLKIASRNGKNLLILFVDLDRMKKINDTMGHRMGDQALIEISNVLKETFRASDIIARFGGDEFAVIVTETCNCEEKILITRLQKILAAHNARKKYPYTLSISVGTACYDPGSSLSFDEVLAQADALMYRQKHSKQKMRV